MSVAGHQRQNHEATDVTLADIRGLAHAVDLISADLPLGTSAAAEAFVAVLSGLMARMEDLDRLRAAEWAGLGGRADCLSAEEIARARGEDVLRQVGGTEPPNEDQKALGALAAVIDDKLRETLALLDRIRSREVAG